jgi:hypothetical protein
MADKSSRRHLSKTTGNPLKEKRALVSRQRSRCACRAPIHRDVGSAA